jgi:hypothetical protein
VAVRGLLINSLILNMSLHPRQCDLLLCAQHIAQDWRLAIGGSGSSTGWELETMHTRVFIQFYGGC